MAVDILQAESAPELDDAEEPETHGGARDGAAQAPGGVPLGKACFFSGSNSRHTQQAAGRVRLQVTVTYQFSQPPTGCRL